MAYIPTDPHLYQGKQVIINSDRLLFNAKTDSILGTAKVSVGFSTEGTFNIAADDHTIIDSPKIYNGHPELFPSIIVLDIYVVSLVIRYNDPKTIFFPFIPSNIFILKRKSFI